MSAVSGDATIGPAVVLILVMHPGDTINFNGLLFTILPKFQHTQAIWEV